MSHPASTFMVVARRLTDAETRPVMEAAGLTPLTAYPGADVPWPCRCKVCGTEGAPRYNGVKGGRGGCVPCGIARRGVSRRVDDAAARAAMHAAGVTPLETYPGARKPWRCRCNTCGKEVSPWYTSVQQGRGGCGYCAGHRLDAEDAEAIMTAAGLTPLVPYPGALKPWRCSCNNCGEEVAPWYASVQQGQGGCRFCAPNAPVDPDEAAEVMQRAGLEPLEPYPGSNLPWRCRCGACEREVTPTYSSIRNGSGCRYCNTGAFPHDPEFAIQAMVEACAERGKPIHRTPNTTYVQAHAPIEFRCGRCGQLCTPTYASVISRDQGPCRWCSVGSLDYNAPTDLYLLVHFELGVAKIGITNEGSDRIERFVERGFDCLDVIRYDTGREAQGIEQTLHHFLRAKGCQPDRKRDDTFASRVEEAIGHLMGHTEVFEFGSFDFNDLTTLIDAAI